MKAVGRLFVFGLVGALVGRASAADYYVDSGNAAPSAPYTNWATAATHIQQAVDAASAGDTVWVAPGIYAATNAVIPPGGTNVVEILKPLMLRAGGGAADTLIDGEGANRCILVSYNVAPPDNLFILDGFTLTNGIASRGGGIFYDTYAGGTPNKKISTRLFNDVITDNVATNGSGGGLSGTSETSGVNGLNLVMSNCVVRNNRALKANGGGMLWSVRSPLYVYHSRFENNAATNVAYLSGGGVMLDTLYSETVFERTVFRGNRASSSGNAATGGGAASFNRVDLRMRNCLLIDNSAQHGGAIYSTDNSNGFELDNCTIVDNRGSLGYTAGGFYIRGGTKTKTVRMRNCIVYHNLNGGGEADPERNLCLGATLVGAFTNNCTTPTNAIAWFYAGGNITNEPVFVDREGGNVRLDHGSPGINAGANLPWMSDAMDLDGAPRIDSTSVDMGCYEYLDIPYVNNAGGATNVLISTAWLNGTLLATGSIPTGVSIYWGLTDGGAIATNWAKTNGLNVSSIGGFSVEVADLDYATKYYYRCCATNANGEYWAPSTTNFMTPDALLDVDNDGGAVAITARSAWLRGSVTKTVLTPTGILIYWGPGDGGTTATNWAYTNSLGDRSTGPFAVKVAGLQTNTTYYYRCCATNVNGAHWAPASTNFTTSIYGLVKDGETWAEIVIATNAPRLCAIAALEFQYYLEKISGARPPIVYAPSDGPAVQIYVGRSEYTDALGVTDDGLANGAFRMVSGEDWLVLLGQDVDYTPPGDWALSNGDIPRAVAAWDVLTEGLTDTKWGYPFASTYKRWWNPREYDEQMAARYGEDNRHVWNPNGRAWSRTYQGPGAGCGFWERDKGGSMNAVYAFLRGLGARWYMPREVGEVLPAVPSIALPDVDCIDRPDFGLRSWFWYNFASFDFVELMWARRLGMDAEQEVLGDVGYAHGLATIHSRAEMQAAHPEYYALVGGVRLTNYNNNGMPCMSSTGLMHEAEAYGRFLFDHFDAPHMSIWPADGFRKCECDLCAGKTASELVWNFADHVAQDLYTTHPDRLVSCGAYTPYTIAPGTIDHYPTNLGVFVANAARPKMIDEDHWTSYWARVEGWSTPMTTGKVLRCENNRYSLWSEGQPEPFPIIHPHAVARDLHALKGISIGDCGEVSQSGGAWYHPAINHLNLYVQARFLWDADQDIDALLDEYYTLFYGPAAAEMKTVVEFVEANYNKVDSPPDVPLSVRFELESLLHKAEAVAGETVYGQRIQMFFNEMAIRFDRYVDVNNPTPVYPYTNGWASAATTIQDAVNACTNYDTIWVAPGRYTLPSNHVVDDGPNVVYVDRPLNLRAVAGAADTVIDGQGVNRCLSVSYIDAGDLAYFVLDGFTLTNGYAAAGGGLYYNTGALLRNTMKSKVLNCVVAGNVATNGGGGISVVHQGSTQPFIFVMSNCVVRSNRTLSGDGGGGKVLTYGPSFVYDSTIEDNRANESIYMSGGGMTFDALYNSNVIERTVIRGNRCAESGNAGTGGGGLRFNRVDLRMRNCLLAGNVGYQGGAIYAPNNNNVFEFDNCTIVSNRGVLGTAAGGIYCRGGTKGIAFRMRNCIVHQNTNGGGEDDPEANLVIGGTYVQSYTNNCTTPTNGIAGFYQNGNITDRPALADPRHGNFLLSKDSPCVNTGTNLPWLDGTFDLDGYPRKDPKSGVVDMGCYEFYGGGTLFKYY